MDGCPVCYEPLGDASPCALRGFESKCLRLLGRPLPCLPFVLARRLRSSALSFSLSPDDAQQKRTGDVRLAPCGHRLHASCASLTEATALATHGCPALCPLCRSAFTLFRRPRDAPFRGFGLRVCPAAIARPLNDHEAAAGAGAAHNAVHGGHRHALMWALQAALGAAGYEGFSVTSAPPGTGGQAIRVLPVTASTVLHTLHDSPVWSGFAFLTTHDKTFTARAVHPIRHDASRPCPAC